VFSNLIVGRGSALALLAVAVLAGSAQAQVSVVRAQIAVRHPRSTVRNTEGNANVVVWLQPADPGVQVGSVAAKQYQIVQRDKQFHPHVLAIPVGATVTFPNRDPFFHNVFSLYKGERFDLGLYEAGSSRSVRFDRPGVSFVFCNIHPEMNAYILALETPYFAISDAAGEVRIAGVPAGRYRMEIWYERAEGLELAHLRREITVAGPELALGKIEIRESERFLPGHTDKHGRPYDIDRTPY
jgi:plastocyanin